MEKIWLDLRTKLVSHGDPLSRWPPVGLDNVPTVKWCQQATGHTMFTVSLFCSGFYDQTCPFLALKCSLLNSENVYISLMEFQF